MPYRKSRIFTTSSEANGLKLGSVVVKEDQGAYSLNEPSSCSVNFNKLWMVASPMLCLGGQSRRQTFGYGRPFGRNFAQRTRAIVL